ncbi:YggS family pyridoxal phosphate-dependent enzyme [candidate division TA06 bacterium]|uniref:Pyridoxal phosphate homeostasis protein n=1 Tax=candidate division TA06 bacterium TaxID=2250710 RepID=A0A660SMI8_UNCT6|nr:MAG: YggS family pyridoxal phosphate-dependent enzyme [candidate division TA06 bacterium]
MENITRNVKNIIEEIPDDVMLEIAAKTRSADEIKIAIDAGAQIIGENYLQESENVYKILGKTVPWHFIGHLQKNKINRVISIFDMIETIDSFKLANEIDKRCKKNSKVMEVLIEVNSGREENKFGIMPENVITEIEKISKLANIKIKGLMTMGPFSGNPEEARPYFKITKKLFNEIKDMNIHNVEMKYLSMGMTNSYKIAIEEGANIIRIGTLVFGERI